MPYGGDTVQRNSKVFDHFLAIADHLEPQLAWHAQTEADHWTWRSAFRAKLVELLGRTPERVPLDVHWQEEVKTDLFTRHKVYVRSEQHYWIPAYYFVPTGLAKKTPAVICLHGHSGILPYIREGNAQERAKSKTHELDYAVYLAEHGYVTMAPVQRGWNETAPDRGCHRMTMDAFLIGMTPVGLRSWDASRLVDFLETQELVDASRIGVAGLSGGGTVGLFFAALEDRVRVALIAGYLNTFRDSIYEIHHCICNCVPHVMEWGEMSDIGALIAPRPFLVIAGKNDAIFPIEATRKAYARLSDTYALLSARDKLEADFFDGPHAWSNNKTLSFLADHLPT
jgi:dienelactone hydrolase